MAKFLIQGCYTIDGTKGLMKEGAAARKTAVEQWLGKVGAKVEAFYFAFGDVDVYVIVDAPDNITATAVSMAVNQSGAVKTTTTVLITPEEMDQAMRKQVDYRPPGR